jgi:hypothetical protein
MRLQPPLRSDDDHPVPAPASRYSYSFRIRPLRGDVAWPRVHARRSTSGGGQGDSLMLALRLMRSRRGSVQFHRRGDFQLVLAVSTSRSTSAQKQPTPTTRPPADLHHMLADVCADQYCSYAVDTDDDFDSHATGTTCTAQRTLNSRILSQLQIPRAATLVPHDAVSFLGFRIFLLCVMSSSAFPVQCCFGCCSTLPSNLVTACDADQPTNRVRAAHARSCMRVSSVRLCEAVVRCLHLVCVCVVPVVVCAAAVGLTVKSTGAAASQRSAGGHQTTVVEVLEDVECHPPCVSSSRIHSVLELHPAGSVRWSPAIGRRERERGLEGERKGGRMERASLPDRTDGGFTHTPARSVCARTDPSRCTPPPAHRRCLSPKQLIYPHPWPLRLQLLRPTMKRTPSSAWSCSSSTDVLAHVNTAAVAFRMLDGPHPRSTAGHLLGLLVGSVPQQHLSSHDRLPAREILPVPAHPHQHLRCMLSHIPLQLMLLDVEYPMNSKLLGSTAIDLSPLRRSAPGSAPRGCQRGVFPVRNLMGDEVAKVGVVLRQPRRRAWVSNYSPRNRSQQPSHPEVLPRTKLIRSEAM